MKAAILLDEGNIRSYGASMPEDWEPVFLGNRPSDPETLAKTDAEAILTDPMLPITADMIRALPKLKIIQSFGVGYNRIALAAAKEAGVYVCNSPGVNAEAVAEQTVLLILASLRHFHEAERYVYAAKQGEYKKNCFGAALTELSECSVGLLGFGAIGRETAKRLAPFGCRIYYNKRRPLSPEEAFPAEYRSKEDILRTCDIISLHMPVTAETTNIINDETLNLIKEGAILINTARGELVDQEAVCRALTSGRLGFFAADTLAPEPVQPDNPIINLPETLRNRMALSPHIGGITRNTFIRSYAMDYANIQKAMSGERPDHIVNGL